MTKHDNSILLIVEKDQDIEAFEKSQTYHGQYFVLGNLGNLLDTEMDEQFRIKALEKLINQKRCIFRRNYFCVS